MCVYVCIQQNAFDSFTPLEFVLDLTAITDQDVFSQIIGFIFDKQPLIWSDIAYIIGRGLFRKTDEVSLVYRDFAVIITSVNDIELTCCGFNDATWHRTQKRRLRCYCW